MCLFRRGLALLPLLLVVTGQPAAAANEPAFSLSLKDHRFTPGELTIPANVRVRLTIQNQDPTPAEFESNDFKAEKILPPGREVILLIGPLKPGTYEFHDEYHEAESKSRLIVK